MLGPPLLAFMLGKWLLGPVGLDRERESGTLCSHSCQVLPQQRYCENCNAFYVIFLCNCFKILTEVIKGCVWTSTRWQGTWNQICNGDFSVKMGKTPLLAAALQKQPSWPPSTQKGGGRGQPVCSMSRAVCCYLGCVCPRQSPGHGGQQGDPPWRRGAECLAVLWAFPTRCLRVLRNSNRRDRLVNGGDKAGAGAVQEAAGWYLWLFWFSCTQ